MEQSPNGSEPPLIEMGGPCFNCGRPCLNVPLVAASPPPLAERVDLDAFRELIADATESYRNTMHGAKIGKELDGALAELVAEVRRLQADGGRDGLMREIRAHMSERATAQLTREELEFYWAPNGRHR